MAADGTVYHSEEEKFDAIGAALDPNFADSKPAIIKDCQAQLEKVIDSEDYYDVLQVNIKHILRQKSKVLSEKSIWILRQQSVWNCLHSTQ